MSKDSSFTILSLGAPLVEVDGSGPTTDRPGGLAVADGVPTTDHVDLLAGFERTWRVDAPPAITAAVSVTDSPYGVFVTARRCSSPPRRHWWRTFSVSRWPRLRAWLKRHAPTLLALWYLYCDEEEPVPAACTWKDLGIGDTNHVTVHGGDLVVVTFVAP